MWSTSTDFVTPVYCGSLVRAQPQASIYVTRVSIVFASAYASFSGSSLQAPSCELRPLFDDWSCWKLPHRLTDRIRLQPACGPDTRRHTSTRARYLWLRAVYLWNLSTQRGVTREFLVAAEQLRSLPEGFRLIHQPLRT